MDHTHTVIVISHFHSAGKLGESASNKKNWYRIPYFVLTHMAEDMGSMPSEEACKDICEKSATHSLV